ncbi:MAG: NAD(P)H-dependent oxidoreductase subunit E [Armatimonadetes bacterium]|jgi:NADH:ubiquinone oxidoreductase subunit E|nr:NAD(P)H-dependent oxidoreductase subunit E [Armatimonadota bacterium]
MSCTCENKFEELAQFIDNVYDSNHPQSSLIAILHHAQNIYGYLSKDVMDYVSCKTLVPTAEIYGVATFYSYFKLVPQGKHRLSVCMGTACYIRGAGKLLEVIEDALNITPGETTEDKLFTLDETRCIGACGLAPVVTVDEKVYPRVEPEQMLEIIKEYQTEE